MNLRRRELLRALQAGLGAALVGCGRGPSGEVAPSAGRSAGTSAPSGPTAASGAPPIDGGVREADVLVIGAGASGLGAAKELVDAGKRVIVLEGRERIGGRLYTDRTWSTAPVDLGASWIHGEKGGNPVTALVRSLGLETSVTTWENVALYADGERLSKHEARQVERVLARALEAVEEQGGGKDRSVAAAIDAAADELQLSSDERRALAYGVSAQIESDFACDASDLSLRGWAEGKSDEGEDLAFPRGYDQILGALTGGVDVRLSHVVTRVAHDGSGVVVHTSKGTFTAPRAIVTLPLGVLRSGAVKFEPGLPEAKTSAISAMRMDVLQKVYLRFAKPFWPEDVEIFGRVAAGGEFVSLVNMARLAKEPILLFFNAGSYARKVEEMTDDAVRDLATKHLREMFGPAVPTPEACLVTRWGKDPFALGSYSHLPVGAKPSDRKALAAPVGDRLFFAGEATESDYPATVHGALLSGRREARRILGG